MDIQISQVIDHDIASTKMRVQFFTNYGGTSIKVSTMFNRDNLEEYWQYQKTVQKAFNEIAKKYNATMKNRLI
jgi:hypothetical protein